MPHYELPPGAEARKPAPRWLQTAVATVIGTALLVTAFFFALFAVIAATVLVAAVAARWWWISRRIRRDAASAGSAVMEGEYRVVERESRRPR